MKRALLLSLILVLLVLAGCATTQIPEQRILYRTVTLPVPVPPEPPPLLAQPDLWYPGLDPATTPLDVILRAIMHDIVALQDAVAERDAILDVYRTQ